MKCPNCGFETNEMVCPNCGSNIGTTNSNVSDDALAVFNNLEVKSDAAVTETSPMTDINQVNNTTDVKPEEPVNNFVNPEFTVNKVEPEMSAESIPEQVSEVNQKPTVESVNIPEQVSEVAVTPAVEIKPEQVSEPITGDNTETTQVVEEKDPNYDPTGFASLINQPNEEIKEVKEPKKSKLPIILVIVILLLVGACVYFFLTKGKNNSDTLDTKKSTSFFLYSDGKYALFNEDGKKLIDFIFSSAGEFVNGSAYVKNGKEAGVINDKGKYIIELGKYKTVRDYKGFYVVGTENEELLLSSAGKTITSMKNASIVNHTDTYIAIEEEKAYKIYNINGSLIKSITKQGDEELSIDDDDVFISVYYNGKNYVINTSTGKEIASYNAPTTNCFHSISSDGKKLSLNSCVQFYDDDKYNTSVVIDNGKVYDVSETCRVVNFYENGAVICVDHSSKQFLLDDKYNVGINVAYVFFIDSANYVDKGTTGNLVTFHYDGKVKTNNCLSTLFNGDYVNEGLYILYERESEGCSGENKYAYYKADGERAFGSYKRAEKFNKKGFAQVSNDGVKYYLIDKKGNKVTDEYDRIDGALNDEYYYVTSGGKKGVISADGNVLLDVKYEGASATMYNKQYALLTVTKNEYVLYDLKNKKEIVKLDSKPDFYREYFITRKDGKTSYYTYNGKMFFEK